MAEVVVVGSGLAGLAAAYEASRHGHNVTILEAGQKVGGRGTSINMGEFPFNTGPHLLKWGGPFHIFLNKSSKVPIKGRRLDTKMFHQCLKGKSWQPLALDTDSIKSTGLDFEKRVKLMGLRRLMKKAAKKHPEMSFADWVMTQPPHIQFELETWAMMTTWLNLENCGSLSFHSQQSLSGIWNRGLLDVKFGWAELVGRLLAILDRQGVEIHSNAKVERLNIVEGKVRGVFIKGDIKIESHNVILAIPSHLSQKIIHNSGLETTVFTKLLGQKATTLDLVLNGTFLPTGLSFDHNSNILSLVRHNQDTSSIAMMLVHPPGKVTTKMVEEAEIEIDTFLQDFALGWSECVVKRRLSKQITITSALLRDQRPTITEYANRGLLLAGDFVESKYILADAAIDSGLRAGAMLGNNN
jgi:hypothetical protein